MEIDYTKNIQLHIAVQHKPDYLRLGQAYFNEAYKLYPTIVDQLRGTKVDCHTDDRKIPLFLKALNEKLLTK